MRVEGARHRIAYAGNGAIVLFVHIGEQRVHQVGQIVLVLAQWRQVDVEDVQPIIEIVA